MMRSHSDSTQNNRLQRTALRGPPLNRSVTATLDQCFRTGVSHRGREQGDEFCAHWSMGAGSGDAGIGREGHAWGGMARSACP